jgi:thiol-disulfide isomerase/thioredoxin
MAERPGEKTYKGIISREILESDTSFTWYAQNQKAYSPNPDAIAGLRKYGDSITFIVFIGTWCEDSHFVIPRFFRLLDAAGFSKDKVSLIGADRSKKTIGHLAEALGVMSVPTILVMKNGKESGRIVEYGKYGMFDKDMAEILNSINVQTR